MSSDSGSSSAWNTQSEDSAPPSQLYLDQHPALPAAELPTMESSPRISSPITTPAQRYEQQRHNATPSPRPRNSSSIRREKERIKGRKQADAKELRLNRKRLDRQALEQQEEGKTARGDSLALQEKIRTSADSAKSTKSHPSVRGYKRSEKPKPEKRLHVKRGIRVPRQRSPRVEEEDEQNAPEPDPPGLQAVSRLPGPKRSMFRRVRDFFGLP
ncbi:hypothetical protein CLAFUW4_10642 [Fulvia fulva]|uniref:Uncharacterized protein n=1 Tax=Passalora fulva TaxID=5499 RepID=A0A9Q8LI44_PASFU|nr:uncharacterized protein CLAFUR5_05255 [Fulvia fulva]KAK4616209.1 hypothetical protein CLAFUR4_10647 [Fulvia fulva]KAK4616696.1 hypothetical protein CLAFUR0_10597 [Fulvia fulva]UJO17033.1 hypothetical protein CLAFUR5_05255 [Fulvia fulva]WPV19373.1 hypothetical protein CLAFUW4_10642 [Fulvia fulva]WPV33962.1 hypothetical protein CLAFUW7_10644 [Fulvia fulva]